MKSSLIVRGLSEPDSNKATVVRPLHDGRVICWGLAKNWKAIILAAYERAKRKGNGKPFTAVLMFPSGATRQEAERAMIEDVAKRLGVERLEWLDEEA
jgi:actin-like ATPase involved in cell morphogenesis